MPAVTRRSRAQVNNHDWPDQVAALLDRGSSVSEMCQGQMAPLHFAAAYNRTATVRVLLERGADATLKNRVGDTPAMIARDLGYDALAAEIDRFTPQLFGGDATARRAEEPEPDAADEQQQEEDDEEDEDGDEPRGRKADVRGGKRGRSESSLAHLRRRGRWRKEAKRELR